MKSWFPGLFSRSLELAAVVIPKTRCTEFHRTMALDRAQQELRERLGRIRLKFEQLTRYQLESADSDDKRSMSDGDDVPGCAP